MAFRTVVRKFVRRTTSGDGENGVAVTAYRHAGDTAMGTADTAGSGDEAGLATITLEDYEPHYLSATVGGTTLQSSSRDVGFIGTVSGYDLDLFGLLHTDGVVKGRDNELAVTAAGSDMNVDIDTGAFVALGHPARNTQAAEVTIGANASGNPRIDRIVVRFVPKGQTTEGDFSFAVLEGTPAGSPSAPSVTQSSSVWEVSLAQVAVANGAATIAQGNITDERPFCFPRYPADPGADRVLFWDDSAGTWTWLALDTGLSISGTTLSLDADLVTLSTAFASASASAAASLALHEDTDNGTNKVTLIAPASVASDKTVTLQDVTGTVYVSGGTDVSLADGGTGASLVDPNADRILFWDDSESSTAFLTAGSNLAISATTINLATNVDVAGTLDVTGAAVLDSTLTVQGGVTIDANADGALTVQQDDGDDVFNVDTNNAIVAVVNAADLKVFSDAYSTLKFQVAGATGVVTLGAAGPTIRAGSGTPEGSVTAVVGSLYLRTNGGASTSLYVKESGSGDTGWVGK